MSGNKDVWWVDVWVMDVRERELRPVKAEQVVASEGLGEDCVKEKGQRAAVVAHALWLQAHPCSWRG